MAVDWPRWLKLVVLAAIAGLGGGFIWGVADHRGANAIYDFTDRHIFFPDHEKEMILVFQCENSTKLVAYDLLNDKVLRNEKAIFDRLSDGSNRLLGSDLFSHAVAFASGGFGAVFSMKDELKTWKISQQSGGPILVVVAVLIPSGYLGYMASSWFQLECGTKLIYDRLEKPVFWAPYRLSAARLLFSEVGYCIDRNATLGRRASRERESLDELLDGIPVGRFEADIVAWRSFVKNLNESVLDARKIVGRFRSHRTLRVGPAEEATKYPPTWGDSIFQRLFGSGDLLTDLLTPADAEIDSDDFAIMADLRQKCKTLNKNEAIRLYEKIVTRTNQTRMEPLAFFDRRQSLIQAVAATMK
jgi:hypothetical protein